MIKFDRITLSHPIRDRVSMKYAKRDRVTLSHKIFDRIATKIKNGN